MNRRWGRVRPAITVVLALGTLLAGAGGAVAATGKGVRYAPRTTLAPGVDYRRFDYAGSHGTAHGHLLTVDLRRRDVSVDLLYPGTVAGRGTVSRLADAAHAVAGINADFFHMSETQHPGVPATGAPVGPAVAHGRQLKSAVPSSQRFGPSLPPGTTTENVLGIGFDRKARLDRLRLVGTVRSGRSTLPLRGFNQYALPQNGVGAYTADWGTASRRRAVCGSDVRRADPCGRNTYEVTVRNGRVTRTATTPGRGAIPPGTVVLLGREDGARALRGLVPGRPVVVRSRLLPVSRQGDLRFAVGGYPILRDRTPLAGLENGTAATRTAAGFGNDGRTLYLMALDGNAESGAGLTVRELAGLMYALGTDAAVNLDGGGSSTLVTRSPGAPRVTVRNHPTGGVERAVANGIGVFTTRR
ncbi:phosphodiester glycosidase family protein [Streptomyces sp. MI02-7b]|uniref:phosphodiester glycosidase family protein n=1 Tax=Streptomyces sp. MI02-7b TaxID=462941 RepID=UPI0029B2E8A1|nr:phosphodiester glycosidase family protein [Streptomyces sp. MI02-7b]MDX3071440.1 phosphodiester glycosidase family protein [Streptomyces sp. MI02-7b]